MAPMLAAVLLAMVLGATGKGLGNPLDSGSHSLQFMRDKASSHLPLWAEEFSEEGERAHALINRWLEAFFAATPPQELAPLPPSIPQVRQNPALAAPRLPYQAHETKFDPHRWKKWNESLSCDEMIASGGLLTNGASAALGAEGPAAAQNSKRHTQPQQQRQYLIIAPVGSNFNASKWMTHPSYATYDIVALYYGSSKDYTCPLCRAVIQGSGAKWGLLNGFVKGHANLWAEMAAQYEAVMVADGDLDFIDTCTLNRMFEVFSAYKLLMGQPSLCRQQYRSTWWEHLYRQPASVLRYVSFVEIMAPVFNKEFFSHFVLPTLWDAYTGKKLQCWALDFVWPYLLRYPRRHIAVIDDVCMVHSNAAGQSHGENNLYAVPVPYNEREEESRRLAQYGYWPSRVAAMGIPYRGMETFGVVERTITKPEDVPPESYNHLAAAAGPAASSRFIEGLSFGVRDTTSEKNNMVREVHVLLGLAAVILLALGVATLTRRKQGRQGRGRSPKHHMTALA